MATYVNDLRLKEISTGDESGTWGTSTNTNLELIGEALGYATQQVFSSDADATTTVADGASDPARAMYFKITSAGNLTATRTCTIAPNTVSRVMFIENATSGSQSIAISQGSGANVTIATGKTAVVYLDGAGSGAAVVDAMLGVDPGVTDTLTEVLVAGNTSGGTNIELSTTDKVQFRDAAIYINSSADGQLDLIADTEIQIAATTVDLNGNLDISGTATGASSFATAAGGTFTTAAGNDLNIVYPDGRSLFFKEAGTTTLTLDNAQGATFAGKITADAGIDIDNINIDGTTIALSSGDLTLDVAGDIILDADGGDVFLRDAGSEFGRFQGSSQDLLIRNDTQDKDISFVGNDGGVTTTALALDMSAAGAATFSSTITTGGNITIGNTSLSQPILQFLSATNGANTIHFGDGTSADAYKGYINYNHTADRLELVGSGDITLDAAGDINLDADGGDIQLKDAGVATGRLGLENGDLNIASMRQDYDIKFKGMDGNTTPFIALTLDMSAAGAATFNSTVTSASSGTTFNSSTAGGYIQVAGSSSNFWAIGSTGGTAAPTSASTSYGLHNWNGSAWSNPFSISNAGAATFGGSITATAAAINGQLNVTGTTNSNNIYAQQLSTQFDTSSFLRLHPTSTTDNGGFTNIFFGTSTANNYGVAVGGKRGLANPTPFFAVRMLNDSTTGTEVLNITNAGEVTKPYQPAFYATPSSAQSNIAANDSAITVDLGTEIYDVGGNFASSTFTAPVTGKYQLNLSLYLTTVDTGASYVLVGIVTSNRNYINILAPKYASDPAYLTQNISTLADMDVNDTAYVYYQQSGGAAQTAVQDDTRGSFFQGYLVA